MFLKQIAQTIHFYIRKNNLQNVISLLVENPSDSKLWTYVSKLNTLLSSPKEIYSWKEAKYLSFLRNVDSDQDNQKKFWLYKAPFKNNNLFLILLVYYFLNAKNKSKEKWIFDIIELYYLIIIYRKKFDVKLRNKLSNLSKIKYKDIKFNFNFLSKYKYFIVTSFVFLFFLWFLFTMKLTNHNFLQTNVLSEWLWNVDNILYWSLIFDWTWDVFWYLDSSDIYWNKFLNILIIFLSVSFIWYLKDIVKSEYIEKIVSFFTWKIFFIFWFFNYLISLVNNFFIFNLFKFFHLLKYNFTIYILPFFIFLIFLVYFFFVYLLSFFVLYLFWIELSYLYLYVLWLSLWLMYLNLNWWMSNFENFLILINDDLWK